MRNPTTIKILVLLLLLLVIKPEAAQCQTLYAIIVAATNDPDKEISQGIRLSVNELKKELKIIQENTGFQYKEYDFTGNNFSSSIVKSQIESMTCGSDDVIFFFYNGHGYRDKQKRSSWPILAVGYNILYASDLASYSLTFDDITYLLKSKGARLSIAIAECCNNEVGYISAINKDIKGLASLDLAIRNPLRYAELYKNVKGSIEVAACEPGERAYISSSNGSCFIKSFLEVQKELASISNNANWMDLLEKAKKRTTTLCEVNNLDKQTPHYEINITNYAQNTVRWDGYIDNNIDVFDNPPPNFQYQNPYTFQKYTVAKIVFYNNNRAFFLMSDNYIVEYMQYSGLVFRGYRGMTAFPSLFRWAIFNPDSPNTFLVWEVDGRGLIWQSNPYYGWQNVGIVYY